MSARPSWLPAAKPKARPNARNRAAAKPGSPAKRRHIEAEHGRALIAWRDVAKGRHPELVWLHHIPNGIATSKTQGALAKAEGLTKGILDYFLPVARGGYHGLYIELKAPEHKGTKSQGLSDRQQEFITFLTAHRYAHVVAFHWIEARDSVLEYLSRPVTQILETIPSQQKEQAAHE